MCITQFINSQFMEYQTRVNRYILTIFVQATAGVFLVLQYLTTVQRALEISILQMVSQRTVEIFHSMRTSRRVKNYSYQQNTQKQRRFVLRKFQIFESPTDNRGQRNIKDISDELEEERLTIYSRFTVSLVYLCLQGSRLLSLLLTNPKNLYLSKRCT